MSTPHENTKAIILTTIQDLVTNFLYYDRKGDETLPRGAIERAVGDGVITKDEMVKCFSEALGNLSGRL